MSDSTRRNFLRQSGLGLAGIGTAGFVLSAGTQPTVAVVSGEEANRVMIQLGTIPKDSSPAKGELRLISPQPYGPFYRPGAPFRAKLSCLASRARPLFCPAASGRLIRNGPCPA